MRSPMTDVEDRFWSLVRIGDGCWEWTGSRHRRKYGRFTMRGGRVAISHRVAWEMANGPIPDGMFVCHRCDNPPCVRPSHLFLGDAKDNAADMVSKGRHVPNRPTGETNGRALLTADQVREIRARCGSTRAGLAREFGVSVGAIRHVLDGNSWRHVS